MKQFDIILEDKPGELAKLASVLNPINIRNMTAITHEGEGFARIITMDESATCSILTKHNYNFIEEDIIIVSLQDRPGELAKLAHMLGESRINIEALYLIDRGLFGLLVGKRDMSQAKKVLRKFIIEA